MRQVVNSDLCEKTFVESLILSLKSIFKQCHLELSYKKVSWTCKKYESFQVFSLETYGILVSRVHNIYKGESIQLSLYPVQTHCVK